MGECMMQKIGGGGSEELNYANGFITLSGKITCTISGLNFKPNSISIAYADNATNYTAYADSTGIIIGVYAVRGNVLRTLKWDKNGNRYDTSATVTFGDDSVTITCSGCTFGNSKGTHNSYYYLIT